MAEKSDFQKAIKEVVDRFRNKANRVGFVNELRTQADLLDRDPNWTKASAEDPDPDPDDPMYNPLGARPAPRGATRADEETAPEPDSASIQDKLAAEADVSGRGAEARKKAPPSDQDAVEAKEGMQASADKYGDAQEWAEERAEMGKGEEWDPKKGRTTDPGKVTRTDDDDDDDDRRPARATSAPVGKETASQRASREAAEKKSAEATKKPTKR